MLNNVDEVIDAYKEEEEIDVLGSYTGGEEPIQDNDDI